MSETTYVKAINAALASAMRADASVFVMGEDVAEGGPYTATAGLAEEFGRERVRNTPISEGAICGVAIGAAQSGLRPVLEIMFIDFITLALDQLVNQAAKAHSMSGGQLSVPLVLRTQGGAGQRGGAQHSQSLEAWLTHVPGLKVVMPSRALDAAGLLASAIADPNPVVFVENKALYFRREEVPEDPPAVAIGSAVTLRSGSDVTIVALSRMVGEALAAAEQLAGEGVEAEVIDPRTLVPLDLETIVESVARTGRLVVAHEAVAFGGFGAEIAAEVGAAAFDFLDAPIERVGAPFTPIPLSPPLEDAYLPGVCRDRRRGPARHGARAGARLNGADQLSSAAAPISSPSVVSECPGTRLRAPWRSTSSRFVSASRACSRATFSARTPSRRSIASISAMCWLWATTRISREAGSSASVSTKEVAEANGTQVTASSARSSSSLPARRTSTAWKRPLRPT